jgi:hypothetical protein
MSIYVAAWFRVKLEPAKRQTLLFVTGTGGRCSEERSRQGGDHRATEIKRPAYSVVEKHFCHQCY